MDQLSDKKTWSGDIKEAGKVIKELPDNFKGSLHISLTSEDKKYEADMLVQNNFIIAASFKDPISRKSIYGEKALDELITNAKNSQGVFELNTLTDNEFRLVANANEEALLELIRDLVKVLYEIGAGEDELLKPIEGWEDLEDQWSSLERKWRELSEREKTLKDLILRQDLTSEGVPEAVKALADAVKVKAEVTMPRKETLLEEEKPRQNLLREEVKAEPEVQAEEVPDEVILRDESEELSGDVEKHISEPEKSLKTSEEDYLSEAESLSEEIRKELEQISEEVLPKQHEVSEKSVEEHPVKKEQQKEADLSVERQKLKEFLERRKTKTELDKPTLTVKEEESIQKPPVKEEAEADVNIKEFLRRKEALLEEKIKKIREEQVLEVSPEITEKGLQQVKEQAAQPEPKPEKTDLTKLRETVERLQDEVGEGQKLAKTPVKESTPQWIDRASLGIKKLKETVGVYWGWDEKKKRFVGIQAPADGKTVEAPAVITLPEKGLKEVKVEVKQEDVLGDKMVQVQPKLLEIPQLVKKIGFKDRLRYVTSKETLQVLAAIDGRKSIDDLSRETGVEINSLKAIIEVLKADGYVTVKTNN